MGEHDADEKFIPVETNYLSMNWLQITGAIVRRDFARAVALSNGELTLEEAEQWYRNIQQSKQASEMSGSSVPLSSPDEPDSVRFFVGDDVAYLAYLAEPANRSGYVLNSTRKPSAAYVMMHRATCRHIQGVPSAGKKWTTGDYSKLWAATSESLCDWVRTVLGCDPIPCKVCKPTIEPLKHVKAEASVDMAAGLAEEPAHELLSGEVIVDLGIEGGRLTIYRVMRDGVWAFWASGTSLGLDDNDDEIWTAWRSNQTERDFASLLPQDWPAFYPLFVHPDCVPWLLKALDGLGDMKPEIHAHWRNVLA